MNLKIKILIGVILGVGGYVAYKKLLKTKAIIVDTGTDSILPPVVGSSTALTPFMTSSAVAGMLGR